MNCAIWSGRGGSNLIVHDSKLIPFGRKSNDHSKKILAAGGINPRRSYDKTGRSDLEKKRFPLRFALSVDGQRIDRIAYLIPLP
jgi:hypothetical protein